MFGIVTLHLLLWRVDSFYNTLGLLYQVSRVTDYFDSNNGYNIDNSINITFVFCCLLMPYMGSMSPLSLSLSPSVPNSTLVNRLTS